jgi:hypothetical protein
MSKNNKLILLIALLPVVAWAANELNSNVSAVFTKNNSTYQLSIANASTITGNFAYDVTHSVSTAAAGTAISFGVALPVGEVILHNITTNAGYSVAYGTNTTALFGVLAPGQFAKFRPANGGTNLVLISQSGTNVPATVRVFGVTQ